LRRPLIPLTLCFLTLLAAAASCDSAGTNIGSSFPDSNAGGGGDSGDGGGGSGGDSGAGGQTNPGGGTGGSTTGGTAGGTALLGGGAGAAGKDLDGGTSLQDAKPDVEGDASCLDGGNNPGPGPLPRVCAPLTDNECAGASDVNPALPNGLSGNGYDDDCDGQVDEGCACDNDHPVGTTKPCYLVPSSQASSSGVPVGWCAKNSQGTVACVQQGSGEFTSRTWDGYCKGAQPAYADDVCAPGDYDCDGADANSKTQDCACVDVQVECPTEPIVISPYPDPTNLEKKKPNPYDPHPEQPFVIDGWSWIKDNKGDKTTDWQWAVTGGDCDNILPHPTFAFYNGKNTQQAQRVGVEFKNGGTNGKQKGLITAPNTAQHQIWPAFSLSGDYTVAGAFKVNGKAYACTVKVQVRAPGLRAELCWDMKSDFTGLSSSDVDLHFARLQGNASCDKKHGWFKGCGAAPGADDCFYDCGSGCRTGNTGFCLGQDAPQPGWGYPASPATACHGWGSLRENQQSCDNPRLDRDNLGCNTNLTDPGTVPSGLDNPLFDFCGPENINLDNPNASDQFLVGVHFYSGDQAHPHVNIYCNGERKLALGSDPTTSPPGTLPLLSQAFNPGMMESFYRGDFWEVARVTWKGDPNDPCGIEPIPSKTPKSDKDGSANSCVDTNAQNKSTPTMDDGWLFTPGGGYPHSPAPASAACWH
jgi:hypothetical protein